METNARYTLIGLFTLGMIGAVFGFVYWLQNMGGLGQRSIYRIRFESTVSGLLIGSNVLFNGIRVGEVIGLQLDPEQPRQVMATIAVASSTPVRADTSASMDFQGLTGAPVIVLTGGSATASALSTADGQPALLVARADAGQTLSQSARDTLGRLDRVLSENSAPLHDAIEGISTFSQVLSRNSDRIAGILAGLERMTGGAAGKARPQTYDLTAARDFPTCARPIEMQLTVPEPLALMSLNTDKIPVDGVLPEAGGFDTAQLADNIPALVQARVIESLENYGCFRSVMRPLEGLEGGYQLLLEIRNFRAVMSPNAAADVSFSAKVIAAKSKVVGFEVFHEIVPLKSQDAGGAVAALDAAFGKVTSALVPWVAQQTADHNEGKRAAP